MKISHFAAATGLVLASLGVATTADAQPYRGDHHDVGYDHDHGHGDGDRHFDNGRRGDRGYRGHPRCHTEYRHHHRVRICR